MYGNRLYLLTSRVTVMELFVYSTVLLGRRLGGQILVEEQHLLM